MLGLLQEHSLHCSGTYVPDLVETLSHFSLVIPTKFLWHLQLFTFITQPGSEQFSNFACKYTNMKAVNVKKTSARHFTPLQK